MMVNICLQFFFLCNQYLHYIRGAFTSYKNKNKSGIQHKSVVFIPLRKAVKPVYKEHLLYRSCLGLPKLIQPTILMLCLEYKASSLQKRFWLSLGSVFIGLTVYKYLIFQSHKEVLNVINMTFHKQRGPLEKFNCNADIECNK